MKREWNGLYRALAIAVGLFVSVSARAGMPGLNFSYSAVFLNSSTTQGGSGPIGSTILSQGDLLWNFSFFGIGALMQYDKQGSNETDLTVGPKLEFHWGPFYIEGSFTPLVQRAFTDRSIARQKGNGFLFGLGVRFLLTSSDSGVKNGLFFQASYKYRIQTIKTQDNAEMSEPIKQSDSYPLVGLGWAF